MFSSEKNPLNAREKLVMDLINAASAGNWDSVDSLAPLVAGMNGQEMLGFLLSQTRSEDDNVRDGAMTGWFYIKPGMNFKQLHFARAKEMVMSDDHECAAVWAAATLCRYVDDEELGQQAREALEDFKTRIAEMDKEEKGTDWQEARNRVVKKVGEKLPQIENLI